MKHCKRAMTEIQKLLKDCLNSEEDTSRQETLNEHTTTSVFAREGQDAPEQSFRDNKIQKPVMLELS